MNTHGHLGIFAGLLALAGVALLALYWPKPAHSQEHNFAGSIQTNYLYVPTDDAAHEQTLDGFTNELSMKVAVDFSDHISANVKMCHGCHGVEIGMAFVDLRLVDELSFRVGRFNPAFGDFPLRHDPANHRTSDKPLPYDMGRMLRMREYNMSVLPAPYVDTGVEINGSHWFGQHVQLDYAAYLVSGLRASDGALDVDFIQTRSVYYIDNNSEPAIGGRVALTLDLTRDLMATLGTSFTAGHYDPSRTQGYAIWGADLYMRIAMLNLHAEYLVRRTEMGRSGPGDEVFRYGPGKSGEYDYDFLKDGFYIEASAPLGTRVELVGRFDGLRRIGNVPLGSLLRKESGMLRYTAGVNFIFEGSVRLKLSGELYDFSDFDDEVAANAGIVAAF